MQKQQLDKESYFELLNVANDHIDLIFQELGIDVNYYTEDDIRIPCPIHGGENRTAFSYNKRFKKWKCFTKHCHHDGDSIVHLVKKIKAISYWDAIKWLQTTLNVSTKKNANNKSDNLYNIISRLKSKHKEPNLLDIPLKSLTKEKSVYFINQFKQETIDKFYIRYCSDVNKPMFLRDFAPIIDISGQTILGVTGRSIYEECQVCLNYHDKNYTCPEYVVPKWKHYGFEKNYVLYNINNAKDLAQKTQNIVLVEGPKDVWTVDELGIINVVCTLGTSISEYQIKTMLQNGVVNTFLLFDNDRPGQIFAEKVQSQLSNLFNVYTLSHLLPENKDPGDEESKEVIQEKIKPIIENYAK